MCGFRLQPRYTQHREDTAAYHTREVRGGRTKHPRISVVSSVLVFEVKARHEPQDAAAAISTRKRGVTAGHASQV